ncbi:MAG: UDP-2,3-diacylglucosamine diphosphatase [Gammaproteobacteria bacterium]|nr:UDP-2,3-diacylglucosamine diphosphatase [Gammaproteobacteria bacterium]
MNSVIHCISDLHLSEDQPHLFALFEHYMKTYAPASNQLFVLGDLFEVWIGDDHQSELNAKVIQLFADYSKNGELFFMHGNRDFLLGEQFAQQCGGQLVDEPHPINWHEYQIAFMHGDSFCIDDQPYQDFRAKVRTSEWQQAFLSQSIEERLKIVNDLRQQSKAAQKEKSYEIMDVNQGAVEDFIKSNQCDYLIHGHTHRPFLHELNINGSHHNRLVLSDWNDRGHFLEMISGQFNRHYFTI